MSFRKLLVGSEEVDNRMSAQPKSQPTRRRRMGGGVGENPSQAEGEVRYIFVKGLVTSQRPIVPLGMDTIGEKSG